MKENATLRKRLHNEKAKVQNLEDEVVSLQDDLGKETNKNARLIQKRTDLEKDNEFLSSELSATQKKVKDISRMGLLKVIWLKLIKRL